MDAFDLPIKNGFIWRKKTKKLPYAYLIYLIIHCFFHRLGGPDPLDYISMYANPGDENRGIPPHWHYISYGLSDLHGDGRVHE